MITEKPDPRIFFAAERTLLAWLRTGLTIIGLGFIISRFGLFIQLLGLQTQTSIQHTSTSIPSFLGIAFVVVGSLLIGITAVQHKRFVASLTSEHLPTIYSNNLAFVMSTLIAMLGIILAFYLWYA